MARGPITSSELDRRVTILLEEEIDDGTAVVEGEPVEQGKRWASKYDVSDGERVRAAEQGATLTTRFLMRFDSLTKTIGGKHVLICDGVSYEVTGVKEVGRREGIEVTAVARRD